MARMGTGTGVLEKEFSALILGGYHSRGTLTDEALEKPTIWNTCNSKEIHLEKAEGSLFST